MNAREAAAKFVLAAYQRAERARGEAHALHEAGFHSAAVVWAVRATEILMRDFLLAPYFYEQGASFGDALDRGSRVLGSNRCGEPLGKSRSGTGPLMHP